MSGPNGLFHSETTVTGTERLQGTVNMVMPLSWQAIGYLLLACLLVALGFLATASYSRIETVPGSISLDRGIATMVPSRAGVLTKMDAHDGDRVKAGQRLFYVRSEEDMAGGATAPELVKQALHDQDARLSAQNHLVFAAAGDEAARLRAQIAGAREEIVSMDQQLADQKRLVEAASDEYSEVKQVASRGFISRRDLDTREATLITRRQQLAQIRQAKAAKLADLNEAEREIARSRANSLAQIAATQSQRASLLERLASSEQSAGYVMQAPITGTLTAVTARVGQVASPDQPLALVVPDGAKPTIELYVPTSAAGFLRRGASVHVAVDAFPYQRFGTINTRIALISAAAVARPIGGVSTPVYLVEGDLPKVWMDAFGRRQPLLAGMTLTARITTEKRTLLEWLLEPIFAVRNR